MKKLIALGLLLGFVLTGCAGRPDGTVDTPGLDQISNYTQEQLEGKLIGLSIEDMHNSWGEPDGILYGLWCDIWNFNDKQNQQIAVYYDKDGIVENIICSFSDGETVSNEVQWEYTPSMSFRYPAMPFTFDVSCQEITATCDNGTLIDFDHFDDSSESYPQGKSLTIQNGGKLYWAPWDQEEDVSAAVSAEITFAVLSEENTVLYKGVLVIKQMEETTFGSIYSAVLETGSGLTLIQDEYELGGILT